MNYRLIAYVVAAVLALYVAYAVGLTVAEIRYERVL
jgi:hypothetical protein